MVHSLAMRRCNYYLNVNVFPFTYKCRCQMWAQVHASNSFTDLIRERERERERESEREHYRTLWWQLGVPACWHLGNQLIKILIILLLISSPSFVSSRHMATFRGQINLIELIKKISLIIQEKKNVIGWWNCYLDLPPFLRLAPRYF